MPASWSPPPTIPPEYNGLKLLNPDGSSFDSLQQLEIEEALEAEAFATAGWKDIKSAGVYQAAIERHIQAILPDFPEKLRLKVVVDAGCGAASEITPRLLGRLGCEVVPLDCYYSGFFPRPIEPVDANLEGLKKAVIESGAALGIAHDGDADRMMAVDEKGRFIPGDKLLAILARAVGAKDMVTTLDASMVIEDLGVKVRRTRIGDTWVSEELRKGGDFGGETSGAWIFPDISLCPDGIYAAAVIANVASAEALGDGRRGAGLSAATGQYPERRRAHGKRRSGPGRPQAAIHIEARRPEDDFRRRLAAGAALRHRAQDKADRRGADRGQGRAAL